MSLNIIKVLSVIAFGARWCNKVHDWKREWSDAISSISQAIHFRCLLFEKLKRKVLGIITFHRIFCVITGKRARTYPWNPKYNVPKWFPLKWMPYKNKCHNFTPFYLSFVTPLNSNFITELHDIKKYLLFLQKVLNSKLHKKRKFCT